MTEGSKQGLIKSSKIGLHFVSTCHDLEASTLCRQLTLKLRIGGA